MSDRADMLAAVRDALGRETRVAPGLPAIALAFANGDLTMAGEVATIAVKKLALERAAAVRGVDHIVDRLRVAAATRMEDGQIRDLVRDALLQEPALSDCALREWVKGRPETVRSPSAPRGTIDIRVEDGVVTLDGDLPGLSRKRLAGVLAWWVPGSRDVVNGIGVTPPEDDSDDEIAEAVTLILEKDPLVDAAQIRVGVRRSVVTLAGVVRTDAEREMAEFDAWYVFGVDRVVNHVEVRA
ncbi:MAG TPA: BON domain-containing protein [Alphaproteobacteria bacterium]|nr:BON domain-containing protein [Alphaproteobacteria bacterium]